MTWISSSCSRSPPQSVALGAKQRGRHSNYCRSLQQLLHVIPAQATIPLTEKQHQLHRRIRITAISVLDLDTRLPPSQCLHRPHTAPCLSSCYHPGARSHRPRSPRRIWGRHAGSRPGCWALTSQSRTAALGFPPRHRTPTHCQRGLPTGRRRAEGEGLVLSARAGRQSSESNEARGRGRGAALNRDRRQKNGGSALMLFVVFLVI